MVDDQMLRQAIGIFYAPERLQDALDALAQAGVHDDDIALVARRRSIDTTVVPYLQHLPTRMPEGLVESLREFGPADMAGPIVVSPGTLATFFADAKEHDARSCSPLARHLQERHATFLQGQLDAGACLVWVTVHDSDGEKEAATILLRHSEHQMNCRLKKGTLPCVSLS